VLFEKFDAQGNHINFKIPDKIANGNYKLVIVTGEEEQAFWVCNVSVD